MGELVAISRWLIWRALGALSLNLDSLNRRLSSGDAGNLGTAGYADRVGVGIYGRVDGDETF
jgi:hypothetical protein